MLNKVILIGRLCKDPELRYTGSGKPVAGFTLAVDRQYKNSQGEKETDFINIVVWQKLAELCANHLQKGRLIAIDGRLQIRQYTDQDNKKRTIAEVVANEVKFLDRGKGSGNNNQQQPSNSGFGEEISFNEEEIPF